MPKNKVNNNIKLKSGGGVLNDATDGLSVDTGTTDGKIVKMTTGDKLPAVDGSNLTNIIQSLAWELLQTSADTERAGNDTSYVKVKEITVGHKGTVRVKFDLKVNSTSTAYGKIYINGVAVGTEQSQTTSYATKTEDFTVNKGDKIQLYCKVFSGTYQWTTKNFQIFYKLYNTLDSVDLN